MACGVAVETEAFPVAIGFRIGLQPRFAKERCEKPVGIEGEQIAQIDFGRGGEGTVGNPNVAERKQLCGMLGLAGNGRETKREKHGGKSAATETD
jgi:hypothetical protein